MLNIRQVLAIVPFSKETLYRRIERRRFPKARRISPSKVGWFEDEVREWQKRMELLAKLSQEEWRSSWKTRNYMRSLSRSGHMVLRPRQRGTD
jgi:prophage regulatory protein